MIKTLLIEKPEILVNKPNNLRLIKPISKHSNFYFNFKYKNMDIDIELENIEEFFYGKNMTFLSARLSTSSDYKERVLKLLNLYFYSEENFEFNIVCHNGNPHKYLKENIPFTSKDFEIVTLSEDTFLLYILTGHFNINSVSN